MFLVKVDQKYRKLDNSDDISELVAPTIEPDNIIKFDPEAQLEHEDWFYIEIDDIHMSMVKEYGDKFLSTVSLNDVTEEEFAKIDLIFRKVENDGLVFQKITKSKRMVDKSILKWIPNIGKPERTIIENGIELKSAIDAYFDGNNRLYFKNFRTIRSLFKGIDDYYRIASQAEVDEFKQFNLVSFASDFEIKTNNLKMLAVLKDYEIDLDDIAVKSTLLRSYSQYPNQEFELDENQNFIIDSNRKLTCLLKLALGRLYTNPITHHKMEANHAKKLN
ncbi:conserved domain protein [Streptococcus mitis SK569]|nr:conserved domain protein [Streptococcus mitis SK569]